jgi:hypothetical protein
MRIFGFGNIMREWFDLPPPVSIRNADFWLWELALKHLLKKVWGSFYPQCGFLALGTPMVWNEAERMILLVSIRNADFWLWERPALFRALECFIFGDLREAPVFRPFQAPRRCLTSYYITLFAFCKALSLFARDSRVFRTSGVSRIC